MSSGQEGVTVTSDVTIEPKRSWDLMMEARIKKVTADSDGHPLKGPGVVCRWETAYALSRLSRLAPFRDNQHHHHGSPNRLYVLRKG